MPTYSAVGLGLVCCFVAAGCLGAWIGDRSRARRKARVTSRPPIALSEGYDRQYAQSEVTAAVFEKAITLIASTYDLPPDRIRLSDRFDDELAFAEPPAPDEELLALTERVRTDAAACGIKVDPAKISTVADLVGLYSQIARTERP